MLFKDDKKHESLIKPAEQVWPKLTKYFKDRGRGFNKPSFTSIHYRYFMDIDDIKPGAKLPTKAEGLRVLAEDDQGPLAFHDMSINFHKPRVFSTRLDPELIRDFNEVRKRLKDQGISENSGEFRHLSVLSLNVEANWYKDDTGNKNEFFVRKHGAKDLETMKESAFLSYLNKLKTKLEKGKEKFNDKKNKDGARFGG